MTSIYSPDSVPDWPGRIAGDWAHDAIAACLVLDIQGSVANARRLLAAIDAAGQDDGANIPYAMNAHIIHIGKSGCRIEPLDDFGDPVPVTVSNDDFTRALMGWIARLEAASGM